MTNATFGIEFDTTHGHRPWIIANSPGRCPWAKIGQPFGLHVGAPSPNGATHINPWASSWGYDDHVHRPESTSSPNGATYVNPRASPWGSDDHVHRPGGSDDHGHRPGGSDDHVHRPGDMADHPTRIGIPRTRIPVAAKTALPIAGAIATMGVSPAPADGISLRSMRMVSIGGMSPKRGTR